MPEPAEAQAPGRVRAAQIGVRERVPVRAELRARGQAQAPETERVVPARVLPVQVQRARAALRGQALRTPWPAQEGQQLNPAAEPPPAAPPSASKGSNVTSRSYSDAKAGASQAKSSYLPPQEKRIRDSAEAVSAYASFFLGRRKRMIPQSIMSTPARLSTADSGVPASLSIPPSQDTRAPAPTEVRFSRP